MSLIKLYSPLKRSQRACSRSSQLRCLGALCVRASLIGRKNNAGYHKWWCLIVMVTVGIRDKGVSGIFLQLNLKDLEHSLGARRLSGIVIGNSRGQGTLLVTQQQELSLIFLTCHGYKLTVPFVSASLCLSFSFCLH